MNMNPDFKLVSSIAEIFRPHVAASFDEMLAEASPQLRSMYEEGIVSHNDFVKMLRIEQLDNAEVVFPDSMSGSTDEPLI